MPAGSTILEAARVLGIEIPTLCYRQGCEPSTSCMVCVVRVHGKSGLVPACSTEVTPGMVVENDTEEIHEARRTALELLLSDHVGDCAGPCRTGCPAGMDIPRMIRQIAAGRFREAIETVKADIALPAAMGRVCPAPCEKICRRAQHDQAVGICLLKRFVADMDLNSASPFVPECAPEKDGSVAIVGGGPAGLAAAYALVRAGYACTLFEKQARLGGGLRDASLAQKLPSSVLDAEIETLRHERLTICTGREIGIDRPWSSLRQAFDAVFLATGRVVESAVSELGLAVRDDRIVIEQSTFETSIRGIFAGGNVTGRKRHLGIRALAHGKHAAVAIDHYLAGRPVVGKDPPLNCRMGPLQETEMAVFMKLADPQTRIDVQEENGFNNRQAQAEAGRCLHCDCRQAEDCLLRRHAGAYHASIRAYRNPRRKFEQDLDHPEVIFEPGKCIGCGLCIQIAQQHGEPLGLALTGRGFDVRVSVPFGRTLAEGLKHSAGAVVEACPTGAMAFRK